MPKLLIQNTEQLTEYLAVPATFNFDGVVPHIWTLQEKFLRPVLSKALLDKLVELSTGATEITEKYNEVLQLSRYVLAQIIMRDTTDLLNINVTQGGFTVNSSEDKVTASANRVLLYKESLTINSQVGFNQLYQFLEDNANQLTEYANSDERKSLKNNFIPDAQTFSGGLIAIEIGHFVFTRMRDVMAVIEARYLIKALGAELYADIQSKLKNSESLGIYAPILPFIQKAIPALVFAECAPNLGISIEEHGVYISYIKNANEPQQKGAAGENTIEKIAARHRQYGMERMEDLTKHLIENKDNYPLFKNSTAFTDRSVDRIEPAKGGVFYGTN